MSAKPQSTRARVEDVDDDDAIEQFESPRKIKHTAAIIADDEEIEDDSGASDEGEASASASMSSAGSAGSRRGRKRDHPTLAPQPLARLVHYLPTP